MEQAVLEPFPCTGWYLCSTNIHFFAKPRWVTYWSCWGAGTPRLSCSLCWGGASTGTVGGHLAGTDNVSTRCGKSLWRAVKAGGAISQSRCATELWSLQQHNRLRYLCTLERSCGWYCRIKPTCCWAKCRFHCPFLCRFWHAGVSE